MDVEGCKSFGWSVASEGTSSFAVSRLCDAYWGLVARGWSERLLAARVLLVGERLVSGQSFRAWVEDAGGSLVVVTEWGDVTFVFSWGAPVDDELSESLGFSGPCRFHVRRAFLPVPVELGEVNGFKRSVLKRGLVAGSHAADDLCRYADDGCDFPKRLSLDAMRGLGFAMKYCDGRDASYVLSWSAFDGLVQDSVQSWADLERVRQHLDMLERCLGDCR